MCIRVHTCAHTQILRQCRSPNSYTALRQLPRRPLPGWTTTTTTTTTPEENTRRPPSRHQATAMQETDHPKTSITTRTPRPNRICPYAAGMQRLTATMLAPCTGGIQNHGQSASSYALAGTGESETRPNCCRPCYSLAGFTHSEARPTSRVLFGEPGPSEAGLPKRKSRPGRRTSHLANS